MVHIKSKEDMRVFAIVAVLLFSYLNSYSQDSRKIGDFDKIIISPHINIVLARGDNTSVTIESSDVDENKIVVNTDNDVLSIYLEGAKYHNKYEKNKQSDRKWKEDIYKNASVTAYITFDYLRTIEVRGDQFVKCKDKIDQNKLKVTLYGEVKFDFKEVLLDDLKLTLYGENEVTISKGRAKEQVIKCYGENEVNLFNLSSKDIKSTLYGENSLNLMAEHEIKVTAFGESEVRFRGDAYIKKGLIIGDTDIKRLKD